MSSFCTAKATHIFSAKNCSIFCVSLDVNFNESLTDDVVSFEQLDPEKYKSIKYTPHPPPQHTHCEKGGKYVHVRDISFSSISVPLNKKMFVSFQSYSTPELWIMSMAGSWLAVLSTGKSLPNQLTLSQLIWICTVFHCMRIFYQQPGSDDLIYKWLWHLNLFNTISIQQSALNQLS